MKTIVLFLMAVAAIAQTVTPGGGGSGGGGGAPTGSAGGVLSGSYPNPGFANQIVLTPSGGDDTAQITAALTSAQSTGKQIFMGPGTFQIQTCSGSSVFTISNPVTLKGSGQASTTINTHCTTQHLFTINWQFQGVPSPPTNIAVAGEFSDFSVTQASGATPTAGDVFHVASASGAGYYVSGLLIRRVTFSNVWDAVYTGTGVYGNWFEDLYCWQSVKAQCFWIDSPAPSGDSWWSDIFSSGETNKGGFLITQTDTNTINNPKLGAGCICIQPGSGQTANNLRIANPSIEQASITIGGGLGTVGVISIIGGEFEGTLSITGGEITISTVLFYAPSIITQSAGSSEITGNIFNASGNAGAVISLTNFAKSDISHNTVYGGGTYFIATDASIQGGLIKQNNTSTLPDNLSSASLVPANTIQGALITPTNASPCNTGQTFTDASYIYSCISSGNIARAPLSSFTSPIGTFAQGGVLTVSPMRCESSASPVTCSFFYAPPVGSTNVLAFGYFSAGGAGTLGCSDNQGNTYSQLGTTASSGSRIYIAFFMAPVATSSGTFTITCSTSTGSFMGLFPANYTGALGAIDGSVVSATGATTITNNVTASFTDVIFSAVGFQGTAATSTPTGFLFRLSDPGHNTSELAAFGDGGIVSAGSYAPSVTFGSSVTNGLMASVAIQQ
jgi:hypothetical protein